MKVVVTNTLTRSKQELVTREPGKVAMYVCGPTVYNHIHIGNARAFIVFDVIRRYLAWRGFEVRFVQNYTDIDDKIIARSQQEGLPAAEVAVRYSREFEKVMTALDVPPPDVLARATDHIPEMLSMIASLIDRGFAYESGGNVWFSVEKFPEYGKLSGRSLEDMRGGERVEPDPSKRHPLDFALWKAAKEGEPSWPSEWGPGRPGWHIECSAMSLKFLGMGFDIHGGGSDLVFPHHENEIAQSEASQGDSPFVRYWLHNGMVHINDEEMHKSLGNFILLKDLLEEVPSGVVRLLAISGHYRSDVDFGPQQLEDIKRVYERFQIFHNSASEFVETSPKVSPGGSAISFIDRFRDAMDDDFNTPAALGVLHDLIRVGNSVIQDSGADVQSRVGEVMGLRDAFEEMTGVLGVSFKSSAGVKADLSDALISLLVEIRDHERNQGRFDQADLIRNRLAELGVLIEDSSGGTRWRRKI